MFRASAAEHQIFHAVDVVHLRGVVVPVEYDNLHILGIGRNQLVGIVRCGDGAQARPAEHRVMEGDEGLLDALGLGVVQPVLHMLSSVARTSAVPHPKARRSVSYFPSREKMKRTPLKSNLNEIFRGDTEFLQIGYGR